MTEYRIILDGLELQARIGIHAGERAAPQRLVVSVWLDIVYGAPLGADAIGAVVDYDFLRSGIIALVGERHFDLQETLVEAIATLALALADRRVRRVRVRTTKPDIYPDAAISCEIVRENSG